MDRNRSPLTRDEHALGLVAGIILGVVGLVVLLGAVAGVLYATDYGVEATVIDKDCTSSGVFGGGATSEVTVKTKLFGVTHTVTDMDDRICGGLRTGDDGNFVIYHLQSGRTILYEREGGACLYDSETALC